MQTHKPGVILWGFITVQAAVAVWLIWYAAPRYPITEWGLVAGLLVLAAVASAFNLRLTVPPGQVTMAFVVAFVALLAQGPVAAALVNVVNTFIGMACGWQLRECKFSLAGLPAERVFTNLGNLVLCALVAGLVYDAAGGAFGIIDANRLLVPLFAATLAYYLVNAAGQGIFISLSHRARFWKICKKHLLPVAPGYLAAACGAAGLVWLYQNVNPGPWLLLFFPPFYIIYYAFSLRVRNTRSEMEYMEELNRLNHSIIASLAMAIDAKDRHTHRHIHRVREYAITLAERLNVSQAELEAIRIASLLHDIGKIGIPERILGKPGKLTPDEFEVIKSHVEIGAMILEPVNFPWPVIPVVLGHHERWDGLGYPNRLQGEEIPVGARIVSLVDVFDALTSDRPYRKAIPQDQALEIIRAGAGTQFDPQVVEAFIEILPEVEERLRQAESEGGGHPTAFRENLSERLAALEAAHAPEPGPQAVLGELADLANDAPRLQPLLRGIAHCVQRLLPGDSYALFLRDPHGSEIFAAHHAGLHSRLFEDLRIVIGEGTSGTVAASGRQMVNVGAGADLSRRVGPEENLELSSCVSVPIAVGRRVIGVITVYSQAHNFYRAHHARQLMLVAEHAAPLLDVALTFEETRQLVTEDALTQLPNAQSLLHFLRQRAAEARRREQPLAVLLVDLNRRRQAAPQVPEEERDAVLQRAAFALRRPIREMDFLARFSETEFIIVLPLCAERQAREVAQRLLDDLRRLPAPSNGQALDPGIGIAVYPGDGEDVQQLLTTAERDLLSAGDPSPASRPALPPGTGPTNASPQKTV